MALRFAPFVAPLASIPAVVMKHLAAAALPPAGDILSALVVRRNPVRPFIRWAGPVAVVPDIARSSRIPVAFDPDVVGSGLRRHAVLARRRRRLPDVNVERDLRMRGRSRRQQES